MRVGNKNNNNNNNNNNNLFLCLFLSVCLSVSLCLSVCLSVCLPVCLSGLLFVFNSVALFRCDCSVLHCVGDCCACGCFWVFVCVCLCICYLLVFVALPTLLTYQSDSPFAAMLRVYPREFGETVVRLMPDLTHEDSQAPKVNGDLPDPAMLFQSMNFEDLWRDANAIAPVLYLRASKLLRIPDAWRPSLLIELEDRGLQCVHKVCLVRFVPRDVVSSNFTIRVCMIMLLFVCFFFDQTNGRNSA